MGIEREKGSDSTHQPPPLVRKALERGGALMADE
jgi:hypothetical protein